ncbi:interferon-inducible GTPase 1-like, partial [Branchiostoma floridae]|uniref:Interferon-inducible GTPase 1-like n=2 Tax=Branchiostoma floridae TaxID=7739 RepID=A0A9J7LTU8_BRAFL
MDDDEEAPPLDVGLLEISEDDLSPQQRKMLHERAADGGGNITAQEALDIAAASESEPDKVKIGIVGDAGAGKSTFINSFRGLSPDDVGAAKVSAFGHATTESESYDVPGKAVVLTDFPGVLFKPKMEASSTDIDGTEKVIFNTSSYLDPNKAKMQECDFFLIFMPNRPGNNVVWIAKEVRKMGKRLLFVRSQADEDIERARHDNPKDFQR